MQKPNGFVAWTGPSLLDGSPVVLVMTNVVHKSRNDKTGDMIQSWILRSDVPPHEAAVSGEDAAVCGECRHRMREYTLPSGRKVRRRTCYVNTWQAPAAVWDAYQRGAYPDLSNHKRAQSLLVAGRALRVGSYGDPAAVPRHVWRTLAGWSTRRTGYTHSDRALADLVMLSVDSPEEASDAAELGLRYFRVGEPGELPGPGEIECPASDRRKARRLALGRAPVTCATCGYCDGTRFDAEGMPVDPRPSVFVPAHGINRNLVGHPRLAVV